MISRIEALNYRCLRYIDQGIGPFQLLVGADETQNDLLSDEVASAIAMEFDEGDSTREMRGWLEDMFLMVHDLKLSIEGCSL
jgi:hypothetical protein